MAVACASRFAVLKLEDDDLSDPSTVSSPNQNLKESNNKSKSKVADVKPSGGVTDAKAKPKKKKKNSANDVAELQNLAFGNGVTKNKTKGGNQSQPAGNQRGPSEKQWEEWKKKDKEFVSETYEQDLQQALLLSRIDYEEKKDVYEAIQKEVENKQTNHQKKKKKGSQKKEKGTMSLDEFQNLHPSEIESGSYLKSGNAAMDDFDIQEKPAPPPPDESDFFDKIEEDAEKIISREHRQESFKKLALSTKPKPESARDLQYQDELQKRDLEIKSLTETVQKLQEELKVVKTRNKKLCGILGAGEMREKAEILVQIEQLTSVKDELTEQVSELHAALEQERSKVHTLQTELKKCHNNRKDRRDSK